MSNVIIDVADAVVATLNAAVDAGSFSQPFTACRSYLPDVPLEGIDGVVVHVIARGTDATNLTRVDDQDLVSVDVAVFKKLPNQQNAAIDPLMVLVQEINGVLRRKLTTVPASWVSRRSDPIYDVEALQARAVFRSATTYTYRVLHDVRI